ncbi:MAG: hypothetical protein PVJ60_02245 [Phycisphaerales bacterium]|jgi:hypothetical protein
MKYVQDPHDVSNLIHIVRRANSPKTLCDRRLYDIPMILTGIRPDQEICPECQAVLKKEKESYHVR